MSDCLLSGENLSLGPTKGKIILKDISFRLNSGEVLWIRGRNGVGKTTFLRALLGKAHIARGKVHSNLDAKEIGYLQQLQNRHFHIPLQIGDVLAFSMNSTKTVEDVLSIGLLDRDHLSLAWNTASGGERKRTLLTRILLSDPRVLLLDEPLSHLDYQSYDLVISALKTFLQDKSGRGILLVEHEFNPEPFGDRVSEMHLGDQS